MLAATLAAIKAIHQSYGGAWQLRSNASTLCVSGAAWIFSLDSMVFVITILTKPALLQVIYGFSLAKLHISLGHFWFFHSFLPFLLWFFFFF